jgi:signal transduction histidine kinase
MNAIEGFTGIILKRMAGIDYNDKAERYLNKIQSNSQRLLGLINDFLDLSRIESGRMELANMPMSPREMVQQWQSSLSSLAEQKGLTFEVLVDPDLPEVMYGDEESLSKIAINLAGNAIKFTEVGSVTLSLQRRGDQMQLEVQDTGIGIPPHAREFIFDEFRQVDQSSKRRYGGTGLGLAIVQKLAREMGGTVTLHSEVGIGSTFTVLLPIQDETEKQFA